MRKFRQLRDAYRFPGFVPATKVHGFFGDPRVGFVPLRRRQKKRSAASVEECATAFTIAGRGWFGICAAVPCGFTWNSSCGGAPARGAGRGRADVCLGWGAKRFDRERTRLKLPH